MEKETGITLLKKEVPQLRAIMALSKRKDQDVETMVKQELEHLESLALTMPAILQCVPISIVSAVKSVLKQNLSLDPHAGLVYTQTRNVEINGKWTKVLEMKPSPNGIISIARQAGRILDQDRPTVQKDATGKVIGVTFKYLVPSVGSDGKKSTRWVEVEFDESDFERWKSASHTERSRGKDDAKSKNYANKLYTSWKGGIDPEFARAKAIRHGLKKLGTNQNEVIYDVPFFSPLVKPDIESESEDAYFVEVVEQKHPVAKVEPKTISVTNNDIPDANEL